MTSEEDLDASRKKVARCGILRAYGLSAISAAVAVEASVKYAGVVEDEQVVGAQEVREVAEEAILPGFFFAE